MPSITELFRTNITLISDSSLFARKTRITLFHDIEYTIHCSFFPKFTGILIFIASEFRASEDSINPTRTVIDSLNQSKDNRDVDFEKKHVVNIDDDEDYDEEEEEYLYSNELDDDTNRHSISTDYGDDLELEDGGDYNEHQEGTKQYVPEDYEEDEDYDDLPEESGFSKSSDTEQRYDDSTKDGNTGYNVQSENLNADSQESSETEGFRNNRDFDENEEEEEYLDNNGEDLETELKQVAHTKGQTNGNADKNEIRKNTFVNTRVKRNSSSSDNTVGDFPNNSQDEPTSEKNENCAEEEQDDSDAFDSKMIGCKRGEIFCMTTGRCTSGRCQDGPDKPKTQIR